MIQMCDLHGQYLRIREEVDTAVQKVINSCAFIDGPEVEAFCGHLAAYLPVPHVIPCGNGTDALQIALMALGLDPEDEVIVPAFTFAAAAEAVALLGQVPVLVDVDPGTFNMNPAKIEEAITNRTKAIIPVHLFGQSCDMEPILKVARMYNLYVIEDNAQSMGAVYTFADGTKRKTGTMGDIATTSFFPSKPLACMGDGGAIFTADDALAEKMRMIAHHGQQTKYHHRIIGCNSRLDTLQAAVLDVKLRHLEAFNEARAAVAARYDKGLASLEDLRIPCRSLRSTHVYHQYTVRIAPEKRDPVRAFLKEKGIPSMVYYPLPLQEQEAYKWIARIPGSIEEATRLSRSVLSLPIHTELQEEEQDYIIQTVRLAVETM